MSIGKRLSGFLGWGRSQKTPGPTPDRLTYAVGDIHGRADLLERMISLIEEDRAGQPADVVFLGDYIDRGANSASVLQRLRTLDLPEADIHCLMGNHERMLLDFLENPIAEGPRWLGNGGLETLSSFIGPDWRPQAGRAYETGYRDRLLEVAEPELFSWLRDLPLQWRSGDLGCVHAIADPLVAWDAQSEATLLWGRPQPRMPKRKDGIWIAHGHTVVSRASVQKERIALDTGAYQTGLLSAARFDQGRIAIFTTTPDSTVQE
ncbi:MAG: metallophosphoesterase [Pseudomonadota bacterium]